MRMRIVAVGGGKGGVGKSLVAANLAIALAEGGARVVAVDADLGCANLHALFGIERPRHTLGAFFAREADTLGELAIATSVAGLELVVGSGAIVGAANISWAQKQRLLRQILALDADVAVIDVGAGTSYNVLDIFDVANVRLMVVSPTLPSVQNAFSFCKGAVVRALRQAFVDAGVDPALGEWRETERLTATIARLSLQHPALGARIAHALSHFNAMIVANQLTRVEDLDLVHALCRMTHDFLGVSANIVGQIYQRPAIAQSVIARRPFLLGAERDDPEARMFRRMARTLLDGVLAEPGRASKALPPAGGPDMGAFDLDPSALRAHPRHAADWAATLETENGIVEGMIADVSENGVRFIGPCGRPIAVSGTAIVCVAGFSGAAEASVRWVSAAEGGRLVVGLELTGGSLTGEILTKSALRYAAAG